MTAPAGSEYRRAPRRQVAGLIEVIDAMTEQRLGRIGNLSETGMLLIAGVPLVEDALYQLRFALPPATPGASPRALELGAQLLWSAAAGAPGQVWAGLRFIALDEAQARALREWVRATG
ncbi:PilZ domain-containing protein [Luteimonas huabeiensis]|uniref:PilZ domain-containing protein n=1 Tax=Luteimonas huabeiensis TaxID=1244513 RepID=UPI0004648911|nr:PilZ domain-containing protein [Luteimonas huabeiensis]